MQPLNFNKFKKRVYVNPLGVSKQNSIDRLIRSNYINSKYIAAGDSPIDYEILKKAFIGITYFESTVAESVKELSNIKITNGGGPTSTQRMLEIIYGNL